MATKTLVEDTIANHDVAIFAKSYCPYCKRAIALINGLGLPAGSVEILQLDERDDGSEIQSYLLDKTGQRTVPNIFIKQKHIGGSDDLNLFSQSGKLKPALGL